MVIPFERPTRPPVQIGVRDKSKRPNPDFPSLREIRASRLGCRELARCLTESAQKSNRLRQDSFTIQRISRRAEARYGQERNSLAHPLRRSGGGFLENALDGLGDGIDVSHTVKRHELTLFAVIGGQRRGLLAIFRQALAERFRIVVGANRAAGGKGLRDGRRIAKSVQNIFGDRWD